MAHGEAFARVPPELQPVLEDLIQREPIFHRAAYGRTTEDFKRLMAPEYWETGASGQHYSREFILQTLAQHPPVDAEDAGWASSDFRLRCLGPDTFLLTYTLDQLDRLTRRATIWQKAGGHWRVLYHQGTIVPLSEVNTAPPKTDPARP